MKRNFQKEAISHKPSFLFPPASTKSSALLTACDVDTTVVLTGTCRTAVAPVPRVIGVPAAPEATATAFETVALMVGNETAEVWTVPATLTAEDAGTCFAWVATVIVCPALGGITPSPCTILIVAAGLASVDATVVMALLFWSATVIPRAGISLKAELVGSAVFKSGVTLTTVLPAGLEEDEVAVLVLAGESAVWTGLDVTCKVAEMPFPLLLLPAAAVKRSWVSLTVVTWDLARVAIMSGVIRSTVCPFASVVIEEGGRRNTSFPWIRKLVAVSGMPLPGWVFMPSCPVIATWKRPEKQLHQTRMQSKAQSDNSKTSPQADVCAAFFSPLWLAFRGMLLLTALLKTDLDAHYKAFPKPYEILWN